MISRIDHVSLAVHDPDGAREFFTRVLGCVPGAGAKDDGLKFTWEVFSLGDLSRLELIAPTETGSFLDNFMEGRKGGGVHHITLETPDIRAAMAHLDRLGVPYFGFNEYVGDFWKEIFIHPRDAYGVLIQIAEFDPNEWIHPDLRSPEGSAVRVSKTADGAQLFVNHPGGGVVEAKLTKSELADLRDEITDLLESD